MRSRLAVALLTASILAPIGASPLRAQRRPVPVIIVPPLTAMAISDLSFGTVLPGIPSTVYASDPRHAGQFEIQGPANSSVRVELALPTALVSSGGALLPISFHHADASAQCNGHTVQFDPHVPVVVSLGSDGRLYIRMGGTVTPSPTQPGGSYSAVIAMSVYNLGS